MFRPKLINNTGDRLIDDLKSRLSNRRRLSVAAAAFSSYAYEALKDELENRLASERRP